MLVACSGTGELANSLVGKYIKKVRLYCHPNMSAYSLVTVDIGDGPELAIEPVCVEVIPKFEVFPINIRIDRFAASPFSFDDIVLQDFKISRTEVIRRTEWFGETLESAESWTEVDAGLKLVSSLQASIELETAAFPMVMKFQFSTAEDEAVGKYFES